MDATQQSSSIITCAFAFAKHGVFTAIHLACWCLASRFGELHVAKFFLGKSWEGGLPRFRFRLGGLGGKRCFGVLCARVLGSDGWVVMPRGSRHGSWGLWLGLRAVPRYGGFALGILRTQCTPGDRKRGHHESYCVSFRHNKVRESKFF